MKQKSKLWVLLLFVISVTQSCKKEYTDAAPLLSTTEISSITSNAAVGGGDITNEGESTVISRGVCWSTEEEPTIADDKTSDGTGIGDYTSNISGLKGDTTYYVRAYATNDAETGYGNQTSFTTQATPDSTLGATIDGTPYIPSSVSARSIGGKIGITAMRGSMNLILWLPESLTIGSHTFTLSGDYVGQYAPNTSTIYSSESGTITISEIDESTGKIKGTFNFVGTNFSTIVNVTDGQFEVYQ